MYDPYVVFDVEVQNYIEEAAAVERHAAEIDAILAATEEG